MKIIWVSEDSGRVNGEGTDGELEELKAVGGVLGFGVCGVGRVEGKDTVPRRGHGTGPLQRHGDEVGVRDVGFDF